MTFWGNKKRWRVHYSLTIPPHPLVGRSSLCHSRGNAIWRRSFHHYVKTARAGFWPTSPFDVGGFEREASASFAFGSPRVARSLCRRLRK